MSGDDENSLAQVRAADLLNAIQGIFEDAGRVIGLRMAINATPRRC
jgi:hypothetical protein